MGSFKKRKDYQDIYNHLYICPNREIIQMNSIINSDNNQLQQEFILKITQIDLLVNTCKQLTNTISTMRNEIGKTKKNKDLFD